MRTQSIAVAIVVLVGASQTVGCSGNAPVIVPTKATIDGNIGSRVAVDGVADIAKAGYVLQAGKFTLIVDLPDGPSDWPSNGSRVRVTGTLQPLDRFYYGPNEFALANASWSRVPDNP